MDTLYYYFSEQFPNYAVILEYLKSMDDYKIILKCAKDGDFNISPVHVRGNQNWLISNLIVEWEQQSIEDAHTTNVSSAHIETLTTNNDTNITEVKALTLSIDE